MFWAKETYSENVIVWLAGCYKDLAVSALFSWWISPYVRQKNRMKTVHEKMETLSMFVSNN